VQWFESHECEYSNGKVQFKYFEAVLECQGVLLNLSHVPAFFHPYKQIFM
jgi:hypothetical protein